MGNGDASMTSGRRARKVGGKGGRSSRHHEEPTREHQGKAARTTASLGKPRAPEVRYGLRCGSCGFGFLSAYRQGGPCPACSGASRPVADLIDIDIPDA